MNRDGVTSIPEVKLAEIAAMYGVRPVLWGPVEGGYRNTSYSFTADDGTGLNFILYKREPGSEDLVRRTNALGLHVAKTGLPVRAPVDGRILKVGGRYGSLYGYLPGETIPWEAYTMKHIKLLGFAMGRFHAAAADFEGELPDVETIYEGITSRMHAYFADEQVQAAMFEKLGVRISLPDFAPLLAAAKELPDRTVLHMDLVRSNVLFADADEHEALVVDSLALTGILDLEKAAVGHPLFDIARTLAFLLVDCNKPAEKVWKYFLESGYRKRGGGNLFLASTLPYSAFSGALGSNYQFVSPSALPGKAEPSKVLQAQVDEPPMLEQLITLFLTYDFYKFLRQNPYESLQENHHFIRTERMLRDRKVLQ